MIDLRKILKKTTPALVLLIITSGSHKVVAQLCLKKLVFTRIIEADADSERAFIQQYFA